ncbi:methylglyoxal reductase (NADPH-dependent) gre2 [Sporothrix eucalyptigena]|uniref:Methylglyoxal reductase (NADPH-dependent) gre2 n=1 Tax=Sporothrix eucalyptigena TaxID=1812306 RepID=A0ABP0CQN8_9PEZI
MTKVLVTGGSGFIAAHIVEQLLIRGHSVVTTVRTQAKADKIYEAHPDLGKDRLHIELTPDLTHADAFDKVVQVPGIEVVLHTASPFHFRVTDPVKDLVEPAVQGTTSVLKAIQKYAPQVRRVVVTSSFAAIVDDNTVNDPTTTYTEKSWCPITLGDVAGNPSKGYRASKKLAEKAAWDYVRDNKPNFDLVTINPPMVFGPIVHHLDDAANINTSNERFVSAVTGVWKKEGGVPNQGPILIWVDVRDVAQAHILAGLEKPEAGGHRLFTTEGFYTNNQIHQILLRNFPEYSAQLEGLQPYEELKEHFAIDNSETQKILGINWIPLEKSVVDAIKSIQPLLK